MTTEKQTTLDTTKLISYFQGKLVAQIFKKKFAELDDKERKFVAEQVEKFTKYKLPRMIEKLSAVYENGTVEKRAKKLIDQAVEVLGYVLSKPLGSHFPEMHQLLTVQDVTDWIFGTTLASKAIPFNTDLVVLKGLQLRDTTTRNAEIAALPEFKIVDNRVVPLSEEEKGGPRQLHPDTPVIATMLKRQGIVFDDTHQTDTTVAPFINGILSQGTYIVRPYSELVEALQRAINYYETNDDPEMRRTVLKGHGFGYDWLEPGRGMSPTTFSFVMDGNDYTLAVLHNGSDPKKYLLLMDSAMTPSLLAIAKKQRADAAKILGNFQGLIKDIMENILSHEDLETWKAELEALASLVDVNADRLIRVKVEETHPLYLLKNTLWLVLRRKFAKKHGLTLRPGNYRDPNAAIEEEEENHIEDLQIEADEQTWNISFEDDQEEDEVEALMAIATKLNAEMEAVTDGVTLKAFMAKKFEEEIGSSPDELFKQIAAQKLDKLAAIKWVFQTYYTILARKAELDPDMYGAQLER